MVQIYKTIRLLVLCFACYPLSFAQTYDTNESNGLDMEFKAINSKSGVLYLGIDNYIEIPKEYFFRNDILISTNNGTIFKDSVFYNIIPRKLPRADVFMHEITGSDTTLLHKQRFKVKYVPQPCITLGGKCLSDIKSVNREFFLKNDSLGVHITDDVEGSENWVKINRFTLGYVYGSVYISYNSNSNIITDEMKSAIVKLRPGEEISIRVSVESEGRVTRNLPVYSAIIL